MKTTKNWVFGCRSLDGDIKQSIDAAIYAAHKYRNKLCELEIAKRARHNEMLERLVPEYVVACDAVAEAEQRVEDLFEEIQSQRMQQRTKTPTGCQHIADEIKSLKSQLKELRSERKRIKQESYKLGAVENAMADNNRQHKDECKQAKQDSGLYWGTEALVSGSCRSFSSGSPPKYKRFEGEGMLAVQLQGGMPTVRIFEENTKCYLERLSGKLADCYLRIGSEGRAPIFAKVQVVLHRELPEDGSIKWAYLEQRKVASHTRWSVRLTIDEDVSTDRDKSTHCAVHFGWHMEPSGLRSALWQGSDGKRGSVILPHSHCRDYAELDEIDSRRDKLRNDATEMLADWIDTGDCIPEWLVEARKYMKKWKSPNRLPGLILKWRDERFGGDEEIFHSMNAFRKREKKLWQNSRRLSVRIFRRRKDIYRNIAKQLSDRYGVVYLGEIAAAKLNENSDPDELKRDNTQAHRHSRWAAVSELRGFIAEKFPLHAISIPAKNVTRECHACGEVNAVKKRKFQCSSCGKTLDVDENALANTLARGGAMQSTGALLELVESQEVKDAARLEKLRKMQDANRAARKRKKIANQNKG